jgi:MFS family permease
VGAWVTCSGAVTVTAGLAALLYALTAAKAAGWTAPATLAPVGAGAALLGAFVAVERRTRAPLVPPATFRVRAVTVANAAVLLESATTAYAFVLTLYFQQVLGLSPLATGLCFLPLMVAAAVAAPLAGRLVAALGGRRAVLLQAMTLRAAGLLLMALAVAGRGLATVIAGTVVWATGKVVADVAGTITATSGLGEDRRGLAAGLLSASQQLGAACGLGVVAAVVAARADALGGHAAGPGAAVAALRWGLLACVAFVALALAVVLVGLRGRHRSQGRGSDAGQDREPVSRPGGRWRCGGGPW